MKKILRKKSICWTIVALSAVPVKAQKFSATEINQAIQIVGCEDFRDSIFEAVQNLVVGQNSSPSTVMLEKVIRQAVERYFAKNLSQGNSTLLTEELYNFVQFLLTEVPLVTGSSEGRLLKSALGALKVGDRSSETSAKLQAVIDLHFKRINSLVKQQGIVCQTFKTKDTFSPSPLQQRALSSNIPLAVMGIRKALATAYQSCHSLQLPPVNDGTPDVEGVVVTGSYPGSWTGKFYKIADHKALNATHYYIKDYVPTAGCIDVKKYSMIYDFGGKPFTTPGPESTLNFWKNNSDGSPGLGIDCSGYVFSSLSGGGLRLIEGKKIRPADVEDFPAAMYINPQSNGLTCLNKAKMGKSGTLKPGDILATKYHVALVESVGKDPLAIKKYDDCRRISYRDFDFVIAQSSPDKGTIGINKFEAKDYLAPFLHFGFRDGLEAYARAACEAYQSGTESTTSSSSFGVSRHKMTPDCIQTDIQLDGQSCIEACSEITQ